MLRDTQATWLPNAGVQVWCVAPRGGDEADTRAGETQVSLVNQGLIHSRRLRQLDCASESRQGCGKTCLGRSVRLPACREG